MANTDLVNEGLLGAYHDELMKTHLAGGVVFDISAYNLTNGQPTPYADLAAAIGTNGANIPEPLRKGGMSVKFIQGTVQSPDNKYVQWRCMAQNFTTDVTQWQGVDDGIHAGSEDLAKSGSIYVEIANKAGETKQQILGVGLYELNKSDIINGYYMLVLKRFVPDTNYCAIIDVSRVKGKHLTAVSNGSIRQYAFFIDHDFETCVLAADRVTTAFVDHTEVPLNANYLYMYLGNSEASVSLPSFVIDEGLTIGEFQKRGKDIEIGILNIAHGLYSSTYKRWRFYNQDKNKYNHIIIPVTAGDSIEIVKGVSNIYATFFRDYYIPPKSSVYTDNRQYVYDPNIISQSENASISNVSSYSGIVPDDAKYLYVLVNDGCTDNRYLPSVLKVNGINAIQGVLMSRKIETIDKLDNNVNDIINVFPFNNIKVFEILKEIYIDGENVNLSGVASIRLAIGFQSGNTYYNLLYLRDSNGTNLVSKAFSYSTLDEAKAQIEKGILDITSFGSNTLGVSRLIIAGDFVNNLGTNNYYDGSFTNECNNLEILPIINSYLESEDKKVGIQKTDSTSFSLIKKVGTKTLSYYWHKKYWESQYNNITVVDTDCWSNGNIGLDGTLLAQCNINFIHMFPDTHNLHVGNGHGCCADKVFKIFLDGKEINLSEMNDGETLLGDDIYIIQQCDGYYPSYERTIENEGDGNKVYAQVDENGQPIKATLWCLDYHMTYLNEKYINKLYIVNDNTTFQRCYGAMNCIFPTSNSHHVSINDSQATLNSYVREDDAWVVTCEHGADLSLQSGEQLLHATKVVQYGDTFRIETECINDDRPTFGKIRPWFAGNTAGGRAKMYLTPIEVTDNLEGNPADVFNAGDVISCHVVRNVSIQ